MTKATPPPPGDSLATQSQLRDPHTFSLFCGKRRTTELIQFEHLVRRCLGLDEEEGVFELKPDYFF